MFQVFFIDLGSSFTNGIMCIFGQEVDAEHSSKTLEHSRNKIRGVREGLVILRN